MTARNTLIQQAAHDLLLHTDKIGSFRFFSKALQESITTLAREIGQSSETGCSCSTDWCTRTEKLIDELEKELYGISEPRWSSNEESMKIKELRSSLHRLYKEVGKCVH